jgi:ABC-type amino acid transport substrate-binding protein
LRKVSERYAALFEALPAQLTAQTRATINQTMAQGMRQTAAIIETTMQQVSAERQATTEQAMGGITQERQGALEQLLEGVAAERRALLVGIAQVLDRGEWSAEQWMTQVFVLLAALILVFFVVRLAYCYAADRPVGTPSRRWTAWLGWGDSRADRGRSSGVRPAQCAPRSAASDAEHAARVPVGTSTCPTHTCRKHARWSVRMGLPGEGVGTGPDTAPTPPLRQASPLPVQQPSRLAKIKQQGRLTAAVQDDFPFSFLDAQQQRVGFDVDLMREFARRWLGDADAVTLVPVTTDRRIPTLLEGNVDLIAAALTNTPARQQQIAFSHTYLQDGQRLLVPEHAEVNDMCDLQGKIIVVTRGSTAIDNVQAQARVCGFTAQLLYVASHAEAVVAVLKGEADAFSTDGLALERLATGRPLKVVGNHFSQEPYGVGLPKGDEPWRRLVNLTLEVLYADGTLAAMYQKWFQDRVRPYPIPPSTRTQRTRISWH